jgi:hypothetical protein
LGRSKFTRIPAEVGSNLICSSLGRSYGREVSLLETIFNGACRLVCIFYSAWARRFIKSISVFEKFISAETSLPDFKD